MRNLFRPPAEALTHDLEAALKAIIDTTPLSRPHAKELPFAVRDLSRLLTQDRSLLSASYWINKRLLTAYCRYFLPWNLVRLSWMLPGLTLPLEENASILDLGSGPLTLPLALWLAKPEWRAMPLTVICCDVAPGPLHLGRDIFHRLAPDSPWKIETVRAPLEKALREFSGKAALITAGNVLNEVRPSRENPLQARLASLTRLIASRLAPGGRFLAIEPGTRLGGKLMALTRQAAFAARLVPEAPCPHWGPCPMLAERATGWCHFSHIAAAAPKTLKELTKRAGLEKDTLSLSCMLLRPATDEETRRAEACLPTLAPDNFPDEFSDDDGFFDEDDLMNGDDAAESGIDAWAEAFAASGPSADANVPDFGRVLSDPIRLPDAEEPARYACSVKGILLALNALRLPSGAAFPVRWPERPTRDAKSGALVVDAPSTKRPGEKPAQKSAPTAAATSRDGSGRNAERGKPQRKGRENNEKGPRGNASETPRGKDRHNERGGRPPAPPREEKPSAPPKERRPGPVRKDNRPLSSRKTGRPASSPKKGGSRER